MEQEKRTPEQAEEELVQVGRDGAQAPEQNPSVSAQQSAEERKAAALRERIAVFRVLAGAYLIYLAVQLAKSFAARVVWDTSKIIFLCGGIVFVAAGIWLIVFYGRDLIKKLIDEIKNQK